MTKVAEVDSADRSALAAVGRVLAGMGGGGFELETVLEQIAAEAHALCSADAAFLFLRDGDVFRFAAASGGRPEHWAFERAHPNPIDRRSIVGRVALAGVPVQIDDIPADAEYDSSAYQEGGMRTLLGVPIHTDEGLIGAFGIGRSVVSPFSAQQIALVTLFADQAAVAIRIARLLGAGSQAQDRERSLGAVLASIARSSFDVEEVLGAVIAEAVRLCNADTGNIAVREGDGYWVKAVAGFSPEYHALVRQNRYEPGRASIIGRTLQERAVVQIPDVLADPEYGLIELQRIGQYRSALGVPIWQGEEIIGVCAVGRNDVKPYSAGEVELIQAFAAQVAIALNLARLLTETHEALERESAVGAVLQTISRSTFELEKVLQTVIDSAVRLTRAADGNILRDEGGVFRMAAYTAGVPESFRAIMDKRPFVAERGSVMGRALMELRPVQVADVLADPEYTLLHAQRESGFRTMLGIPLIHDGTPIGALAVWRLDVIPFSSTEIALLQTFADQAAIAIANVRLFETVERQRAALASFAPHVAGLLSSVEGETLLGGHRREISALFCDMRGFTAFAEMAEPEELFGVLREYHAAVGRIAIDHGGTVEHFAGDGFMIFFNDPTPLPDHPMAAIQSAIAMRERFAGLADGWRRRGYDLGLGIGISVGYATLGRIGFEGRYDYAGVGAVTNLAARLSSAAAAGEILISQRLQAMVEDRVGTEPAGDLTLKGFSHPVPAFRVTGMGTG